MSGSLLLAIFALCIAIGSIVIRYWESPPELSRRIAQLELDLAQSVETVTRWMKRENVRRARDEKEGDGAPNADQRSALTGSLPQGKKEILRERARLRGLVR